MNEAEQGFAELAGVEEAPMINTEVAPEATPQDGAQVTPEPQQAQAPVQEQPQFDPSQMMAQQSEQMMAMAQQIEAMNSKMPEPTPQAMSEDEQIQNKIRDDLGINKMEAQFKEQQGLIEQQKQMMAQMQEQEAIRQREVQFKSLEQEYGNIDRQAIQNHLVELNKTNPQLAEALNSPEGVRMLASQGVGAVVKTPDAITPSQSGVDVSSTDATKRVLDGNGSSDDFGDLLASYVS